LHDPLVVDPAAELTRARQSGVNGCVLAGVSREGWPSQIELALKYPECAVSFGIHPYTAATLTQAAALAMLPDLALALMQHHVPRPVALGEIGLDRATPELRAALPRQEAVFRAQLALARDLDLPVILHVVDAHGLTLEILKRDGLPARGGVVHGFSGSAELAVGYQALNLCISFSGAVCNPRAVKLLRAVPAVAESRLLVETDAPYQTPQEHRPALNELSFLPSIVAKVALLRGADADAIADLTERNARALFGL
jgi:TatD DNase family protein